MDIFVTIYKSKYIYDSSLHSFVLTKNIQFVIQSSIWKNLSIPTITSFPPEMAFYMKLLCRVGSTNTGWHINVHHVKILDTNQVWVEHICLMTSFVVDKNMMSLHNNLIPNRKAFIIGSSGVLSNSSYTRSIITISLHSPRWPQKLPIAAHASV